MQFYGALFNLHEQNTQKMSGLYDLSITLFRFNSILPGVSKIFAVLTNPDWIKVL